MQSFETSLRERVHEVLVAHRERELQPTTGVQATVDELVLRVHGLEQALGEIAAEVDKLTRVETQ